MKWKDPITSRQTQVASLFTAARIGMAAGVSPRTVYNQMERIKPSGQVIQGGKPVSAWTMDILPPVLQSRLAAVAQKRGYRDEQALLSTPPAVWQPEQPLSAYSQDRIDKATRLRSAMARTLSELKDPTISESEAEKRGLQDYRRVFGYDINPRHWQRLLRRIIRRDAGAEDWMRLELYLDDKSAAEPPPRENPSSSIHTDLRDYIAECRAGGIPEPKIKDALWVRVFDHFEAEIESGKAEKEVRKSLLKFLAIEAPFLANTPKALHEQFRVKLQRWQSGGGKPSAIKDRRGETSGNFRRVKLTDEDKKKLIAAASQYGGGLSQAFRELHRKQELSPALLAYYDFNCLNKSHVPRSIREQVQDEIRIVKPWIHGKHTAKVSGAYTERDPDTFHSGDWFQADDLTAPVYYYENENPFSVIRGQTLVMIDYRSWCVLGFVVIPLSQYTSFDVRNLISTVHDGYGLPRKGFYFERGIWKQSRLVTGRKDEVQWGETELGMREFVKFRHAKEARSKVVERILGLLQNHMGAERGYAGRDERNDRYERIQEQIKGVRGMKYHAGEFFLEKNEWVGKLRNIIGIYNSEVQNGKYLPGISPMQGFERFFGDIPLTHLPESCRFVLANHKIPITVGRNGISFRIGKKAFTYKNADTGALIGKTVRVWFNPASPEIISVTNMDNVYLCTVPLAPMIPAMDATPEEMAAAEKVNHEHNSYGKRIFEAIKPNLLSEQFRRRMFKPCLIDANTRMLGSQIKEHQEAVSETIQSTDRIKARARKLADKLKMPAGFSPTSTSPEAMQDRTVGMEKLIRLFDCDDGPRSENVLERVSP